MSFDSRQSMIALLALAVQRGQILVIDDEPKLPDLTAAIEDFGEALKAAPRSSPYNHAGRARHHGEGLQAMMLRLGATPGP